MSGWWGKITGGAFGFILGGPIGGLIGIIAGKFFDDGVKRSSGFINEKERLQVIFYTTTFSVMGHLSKADGQVSPEEIMTAKEIMQNMALNSAQKRASQQLFNQGKAADFPLEDVLVQFRKEIADRTNLLLIFLEIQIIAAYADGILHPKEQDLLRDISLMLGFSEHQFQRLLNMTHSGRANRAYSNNTQKTPNNEIINNAYVVLGISSKAQAKEIKNTYRKLMSQHHPDKLVAKGLPDEMMEIATQKTKEIQKAYDVLKKARKI